MIKFNWKKSTTQNMGSSQHTLYEDARYGVIQECVLFPGGIDLVYWIHMEEGTEFATEADLKEEVEKRIKERKIKDSLRMKKTNEQN